jgi:ribonuclease HII
MSDRIIGADEVGLGCIAGPLVVCAVCVPKNWEPPKGLRDSKKLSADQRMHVKAHLQGQAALGQIHYQIAARSSQNIDQVGIRVALIAALREAITKLQDRYSVSKEDTIMDGNMVLNFATSIVKADDSVPAVSAASVLAKVNRDVIMGSIYDVAHPGYGFAKHKGYGTKEHLAALEKLGPCPLHRKSFAPVARLIRVS